MDEVEKRLVYCFSAVLPKLSEEDIPQAKATSVESWDSVATVSLIAVIEEEFGIAIDADDLSHFDSFQNILRYLEHGDPRRQTAVDFA